MAKKPRIRKAFSVRENSEAFRITTESHKQPPKLSELGAKLLKLGFLPQVAKAMAFIVRPLNKILGWLMPRYFVNSWREVKQVTWPTRSETWRLTGAVLVFAIIFGALVAGVDKVLDEIFKKVILK